MTQHHTKRPWNLLIKVAFSIAFVVVIGYQILHERDLQTMWSSFRAQWTMQGAWLILVALALMPLNWFLETRKWMLLMRPSYNISFRHGIRAITGGIALSLFTPNRIGEYGGRILFVPSAYNWRAVIATLVGSFSQNLVHVSAGLLATWFLISHHVELPLMVSGALRIIAPLFCIGLVVTYFQVPRIGAALKHLKGPGFLRRLWKGCGHLEKISRRELASALMISLSRYVVFGAQFVILLLYFDIGVPTGWLVAGVAMMYFMQTSIPLPPFVDLLARSELAILIWAAYDVNELTVLAASFFIWIINLLIPAFFGLIAISSVNVLQSLGYDKAKESSHHNSSTGSPLDGTSSS